jgi:hypothetical protein
VDEDPPAVLDSWLRRTSRATKRRSLFSGSAASRVRIRASSPSRRSRSRCTTGARSSSDLLRNARWKAATASFVRESSSVLAMAENECPSSRRESVSSSS